MLFFPEFREKEQNQPIVEKYTITYVLNGGTNASDAPTRYQEGIGAKLPTPTKSGYKFLGWSKELDSTTYIIKISTADDGNITLYANWKKNSLSGNIIDAFRKEISLISCQLDYKNYLIRSLESNYQAEILKPLDYEIINASPLPTQWQRS